MTYRCTNAFSYGTAMYPGGVLVDDDAEILSTHRAHFEQVESTAKAVVSPTRTETASAAPGEVRAVTTHAKRGPGRPKKQVAEDDNKAEE